MHEYADDTEQDVAGGRFPLRKPLVRKHISDQNHNGKYGQQICRYAKDTDEKLLQEFSDGSHSGSHENPQRNKKQQNQENPLPDLRPYRCIRLAGRCPSAFLGGRLPTAFFLPLCHS